MQRRDAFAALVTLSLIPLGSGCASRSSTDKILIPGAAGGESRVVEIDRSWVPVTIAALRRSPGCLDVQSGQVGQKRVVFAMFKDKASTIEWYRSSAHQSLVEKVRFYREGDHDPLSNVPDGTGPILVIASMQPAPLQKQAGGPQLLAVELFTPLEAGVRFGNASFLAR